MMNISPPDNYLKCELCDNTALDHDEYCEDHQPCYYCNSREDCDCEDLYLCRCGREKKDGYALCQLCLID